MTRLSAPWDRAEREHIALEHVTNRQLPPLCHKLTSAERARDKARLRAVVRRAMGVTR